MIIVDRGVQRTMSDLVTAVGSKYFCKGVNVWAVLGYDFREA